MNYNPDISITRRSSAVSRYCSAKSHFDEIEEQDEGGSRCDIENQSPTRLQHALLSNSGRKTKCRTPQQILYQAALRDDWESAEPILEKDLSLGRAKMTERGERVLHIAAVARSTRFVQKLVNKLEESDLELPNNGGTNAFCFAAASGVVKIASIMRDKNNKLPKIISKHGSAITMAALLGHKDMMWR
nr:uncharacterized protein LOC104107297 isoform X2 [Nicotiana tomentosiformis]